MNHINMEEVEEQPDAVIGKFLMKSFTALVLFDTGASHSYISRGFVDKFKLPTLALRLPMLVFEIYRLLQTILFLTDSVFFALCVCFDGSMVFFDEFLQ